MRQIDGDIGVEPIHDGGIRVKFIGKTGETIALDVPAISIKEFRRAVILPRKGDHLDMSAIKEVKELIRDDMKRVNDAARIAREKGVALRDRANVAVTKIDAHFDGELKELAELESELAQLSNLPPEGVA